MTKFAKKKQDGILFPVGHSPACHWQPALYAKGDSPHPGNRVMDKYVTIKGLSGDIIWQNRLR